MAVGEGAEQKGASHPLCFERVDASIGELSRLIWGDKVRGGSNTRKLLRALHDLRDARFTVPGYDLVERRPATGTSDTNLLMNLYLDDTLLKVYERQDVDRIESARIFGGKSRGTVGWRMHDDYVSHLAVTELRRFNWAKAQQLRGVALALWMVFTSPRVPYRPMFESTGDLEIVEIPLLEEHCHALGVRAATDAARRRTFNEAGPRVVAADSSFVSFEADGGRGRDSFLRVVRRRPKDWPLERQTARNGQMVLEPSIAA